MTDGERLSGELALGDQFPANQPPKAGAWRLWHEDPAPTDGTVVAVRQVMDDERVSYSAVYYEAGKWHYSGTGVSVNRTPTHWAPLPLELSGEPCRG